MFNKFKLLKKGIIILFVLLGVNEVKLFSDDKSLTSAKKNQISNWKKDSLCCLGFRNRLTTAKIVEQLEIFPLKESEIIDFLGAPYAIYWKEPCLIKNYEKYFASCRRLVYNAEIYCKNDTVLMNQNRVILYVHVDCKNDSVVKYEIIDLE